MMVILLSFVKTQAQYDYPKDSVWLSYPVPTEKHMLFYGQKSWNTNAVIYVANFDENGDLDKEEPVRVYWKQFAKDGGTVELNLLERKFGYGIDMVPVSGRLHTYRGCLVSNKAHTLIIVQDEKYKATLYAILNGVTSILDHVYIDIEGHTVWPKIKSAELFGRSVKDGRPTYEIIYH